MQFPHVNSPAAAFVAGLVTSLHCVGMCGPLACSLLSGRDDRGDARAISTAYHLARLTAYGTLGAIAGGLGRAPLTWFSTSGLQWLPWLLVLLFVALAFRWDRYLPRWGALARLAGMLPGWCSRLSPVGAAAAVGLATPLLPCGPLYFLVGLSLLAGSAARGVEFMLAVGLGTVPLLWLAQSHYQWVRDRLPALWLGRARVMLALSTAAVIGWRLRGTLGFAGPDPASYFCF